MSNIQKALELIETFANGDAKHAEELLDKNYIQHNLNYKTGREAFIKSIEALAKAPAPTTVENIRAYEDHDKVFLQTVYDFAGAGKQVAFDVFRFNQDGKIAEHWDNLAALAQPNPSGRTQIDGPTKVEGLDQTETNRKLIENFLYDIMEGHHPEKMNEYFDGDIYIQHNPSIVDGVSGLLAALNAMAKEGITMVYDKVHQVLADGNFVLAISEGSFAGKPTAFYDLWRLKKGKIAEHWDVMETILPRGQWQNDNGKF